MKFPKNRANVFVVERVDPNYSSVVCGVFADQHEAEDYRGACEQEWKDKFDDWNRTPLFKVSISTFYG